MKIKNKQVTFTLEDDMHLHIAIGMLMKMGEGIKINKSEYIRDSLLANFEIFEDELKTNDNIEQLAKLSKVFVGTKPITVTLPIEVIEKLEYYSEKLGMKKSHLVMCSLLLDEEEED